MAHSIYTTLKLSLGFVAAAAVCSAAGSVASVSSAQPFSVDGIQLSNPGVSSWPLISNDEVRTAAGAALVTFRDGSAVKLAPQSRVRLAGSTMAPQVILIAGNIDTKLAPGSKLIITKDATAGTDTDNGTPDFASANTGARANNNTPIRKAVFLYSMTGLALAGLGLGTDAILQPASVSSR
jgi:hypothetical protein